MVIILFCIDRPQPLVCRQAGGSQNIVSLFNDREIFCGGPWSRIVELVDFMVMELHRKRFRSFCHFFQGRRVLFVLSIALCAVDGPLFSKF